MLATRIANHLSPFLDYLELTKGLSDNTQRNYGLYLKVFLGWLDRSGHRDLTPAELTPDHVWSYRLYLARQHKSPAGRPLAKSSQSGYLIALRALLTYFAAKDITSLAVSKVELPRSRASRKVEFLERPDIERILAVPDTGRIEGLRDRAIMEVLFSSGMRIAELVSLDIGQLAGMMADTVTDKVVEVGIVGKGRRPRTVFLSPRACGWLKDYLIARRDSDKAAFVNVRSRNPSMRRLSARGIELMVRRAAVAAGLDKRVTPHTLRHSYATDLLAQGADLRSVQELLGHKNVATTQVYTHVTNKRLRDIHERFHGGKQD